MPKSKIHLKSKVSKTKKSFGGFGIWGLGLNWKSVFGDWNFRYFSWEKNSGFTLLEMIVSIGIFSILIVAAISIVISISNAQIKAANVQNIQDNIRFTLELITKELRVGFGYSVSSCTGNFCQQINFTTANGEARGYCLESGVIKRLTATAICGFGSPMTSSNVVIDRLYFITSGTAIGGSDGQPSVTVVLESHSADPRQALESKINVQTTVVQRLRDI